MRTGVGESVSVEGSLGRETRLLGTGNDFAKAIRPSEIANATRPGTAQRLKTL